MKTKTQHNNRKRLPRVGRTYTVVGLYSHNRQVWVGEIETEFVEDAVSAAHIEMAEGNGGVGGAVLCVFEGRRKDLYVKKAENKKIE